jgi:hypothetical protein
VITKAKATMAIVTWRTSRNHEVVVFPRLYEQTVVTWRDGNPAGRRTGRPQGEETSLLADLAVEWDAAAAAGGWRGRCR